MSRRDDDGSLQWGCPVPCIETRVLASSSRILAYRSSGLARGSDFTRPHAEVAQVSWC